jgi:hypothetical protein
VASCFWATLGGAELDLLVLQNGLRIGVEIKRADAPRLRLPDLASTPQGASR